MNRLTSAGDRHLPTTTIRFRITALATVATLVVLGIASVALVAIQRETLTRGLDEGLVQRVDDIEARYVAGTLPATLEDLGDDDTVGQVVIDDATVIASSRNVDGMPPIVDPSAPLGPDVRTIHLATDTESAFRLVVRRTVGPDGDATILLAAILDEVDESARAVATALSVVVPATAIVLAIIIWRLVGRTLRPVEGIRRQVADIGASDLTRRVPEPRGDDEIARLARTMNAMLDRVEAAARRQQAFVADASHELRSPLTRIRSTIEVDLAHPTGADLAGTHRSVLEEATSLERLVDDLLHLAQSDASAGMPRHEAVDLDDLVLDEVSRLRAAASVSVDVSGVTAAQVDGNRGQLARLVRNLLDNAQRHATANVTVTLAEDGPAAVLTIHDDGPGIATGDRERIFERFTRLDEAREQASGGTGLGLAICRDIVMRHGGTIGVDPSQGRGARFVVRLPRRADDRPATP